MVQVVVVVVVVTVMTLLAMIVVEEMAVVATMVEVSGDSAAPQIERQRTCGPTFPGFFVGTPFSSIMIVSSTDP